MRDKHAVAKMQVLLRCRYDVHRNTRDVVLRAETLSKLEANNARRFRKYPAALYHRLLSVDGFFFLEACFRVNPIYLVQFTFFQYTVQ